MIFLAIFLVLFIVLVYPSERAKILAYDSEAGTYSVKITGNGFAPAELEVSKGARVSWVNLDSSSHTITFLDSRSNVIYKGGSYSKVFNEEGSYTYSSELNPGFRGTIIVR
ncbi:MAG: cupredoxin domain-containing protein [Candidatus Nanoarchaeia archaeon]|nr:cupredoxin domain-containing protein [Candidatus Nanoarchaeia archaeon]